ncbi:MAG TPA: ABC transporter ATP-binding protein, partial [Acidimicrobiales bacterium]|nr:ABC transporter ATP-binding protein [Acidimicrobiales bacterium]
CIASLTGAEKSFGAVRAVDGITLGVERGEVVALLGPNGAGKTTTISLLLGLLAPDRGGADLFGGPPRAAVRQGRVGAMLQDGGLLDGVRVAELLAMLHALYPAPMPVGRAVALAQLEGLERRRTDRLSGGQSQRLRVACALIGNPELLVLDEPTAAMDVEARRAFWGAMQDLADEGRTVVFSTHYLEEADAFADRVVMIGAGRVVADGTPSHIKSTIGARVVRFRLPRPDSAGLAALAGVRSVTAHGERVELRTTDSDATLRAVLARWPAAHDIEVAGAGLEDAFLALVAA